MSKSYLQIDRSDNNVVALRNLAAGTVATIANQTVVLQENIKAKHKFSLNDFNVGDAILMYGVLIGRAIAHIPKGSAITTANVSHTTAQFNDAEETYKWAPPNVSKWQDRTFNGYHRTDGSVGTANHWLVIPLVFCDNRNVDVLKAALLNALHN
ncbi:altronate dehydratase [Aggregatimonas sangjinii]|uniref:Altronate dehydratase n=1 Tax=Aggregatimonas sangjinii TaxID=2583587 RepID=A0A5B7SQ76_9FLAO|nr:UxaA family hydrolase [Aggregatimonas sangjinii]QCX00687.1 altronate dehydratase [Aggregatimonas sangjinii]